MHNVLLRRFGDFGIWDYGATATRTYQLLVAAKLVQLLEQLHQTM